MLWAMAISCPAVDGKKAALKMRNRHGRAASPMAAAARPLAEASSGFVSSRQETSRAHAGLFGRCRSTVAGLKSRRRLGECPDLLEKGV